jgi:hypothetical protein
MTRVQLRSFDIFDTLLARRCVNPREIFRAVEAAAGHAGFTEMRVRAEAAVHARGEYDLDAIYAEMMAQGLLGEPAATRLKAAELAEEYDNLIPIRQHIREVMPGDLLISDMYLPRPFVERLVRDRCGLHFNPLYLSSHGKRSGRAWEDLTKILSISEHLGDNLHSDIAMSERFGVKARHTDVSKPTPAEVLIAQLGFQDLALATREARLALWSDDPQELALGRAQIGLNFPLLYCCALLLMDLALRRGWKTLLFSSRDCFMLFTLFQHLAERMDVGIEAKYFFTSRLARVTSSISYMRYFDSLCGDKETAVVDICGTGWSLTRLFEAAGRPATHMFFLNLVLNPALAMDYRSIGATQAEPKPTYLTQGGNNDALEALNATDHRMVSDVIEANGVFIPVFRDVPTSPDYDRLVRFSHSAFMLALRAASKISVPQLLNIRSKVRMEHVVRLYQAMSSAGGVVSQIAAQQISENGPVLELLRARAQTQGSG